MFVCCHPGLSVEAQVALTLKVLGGFGEREIAAAFLSSEAAIAKRLARARQFLRDRRVEVELPAIAELAPRVDAVLQTLYLLFNEGYKASHGDTLLREDLCADAIRLAELLVSHPLGNLPATHALLALMRFNSARLPARTDAEGGILLRAEQDRGRWDRAQIVQGLAHLSASAAGNEATRYHLEAGIAACHSLAPDEAATDWKQILSLYDQLLARDASPVVALNRAVALAKVHGPRAGLDALAAMPGRAALENYQLLARSWPASFWLEAGEPGKAAASLRRAHELAAVGAERALMARRLAAVEGLRQGQNRRVNRILNLRLGPVGRRAWPGMGRDR